MCEVFRKLYNRKIVVAAGILIVIVVGFFLYRHFHERSNEDYDGGISYGKNLKEKFGTILIDDDGALKMLPNV